MVGRENERRLKPDHVSLGFTECAERFRELGESCPSFILEASLRVPGREFSGRGPRAEAGREFKRLLYTSRWEWKLFRLRR